MTKQKIVLSLGGSLIAPDRLDVNYLRQFKELILDNLTNFKFYIITGGGRTARDYQAAARALAVVKQADLDWLGISATRLNAELLRGSFGEYAAKSIFHSPEQALELTRGQIVIGGGWQPGWSTDYVAVVTAKLLKIRTVINLSNIDYVYNKDPRRFASAKPYKKISWPELREIVGDDWQPGANWPFDPVACKLAEKIGLRVVMINGRKLPRVSAYLNNRAVHGTVIG